MSNQSSRAGEPQHASHNVLAVYPSVERAREAITNLERNGVEGGNIELLGAGAEGAAVPQTNEAQRSADMAVTGQVGKRSLTGVLIGALVGAAILALVGWAAYELLDVGDELREVVIGAAVAGAIFGAFGGLFYGGATGLPVSDAWGETFEAVRQGSTGVAVHTEDAGEAEKAVAALQTLGGHTKLARFGRDGLTREV
jgi:hypothetical protein